MSLLISQPNGEDQMAQPNRERVQVTAILRLDGQLDHSYALLALPQAQELMGYHEDQITGVELKVDDPFKVQEIDYSMLMIIRNCFIFKTGWQNLAICIVIFNLSVQLCISRWCL